LSEKIKALWDIGNRSLRWRQLKTPLGEKVLDEWFDFIFQKLFRVSGDDEVIRISHHPHLMKIRDSSVPANFSVNTVSSPSSAMFAIVGEAIPPCGVPASVGKSFPDSG
jgi:hypothetical protein